MPGAEDKQQRENLFFTQGQGEREEKPFEHQEESKDSQSARSSSARKRLSPEDFLKISN